MGTGKEMSKVSVELTLNEKVLVEVLRKQHLDPLTVLEDGLKHCKSTKEGNFYNQDYFSGRALRYEKACEEYKKEIFGENKEEE
jgi:hypothetical protein